MILSFDPGKTTGWAMLNLDESIIKVGHFEYEELAEKMEVFPKISFQYVVIEEVVPTGINAHSMALADVSISFKHAFPKALWVRPGLWKPVVQRYRREIIEKGLKKERINTHEGDAVMLAIYALRHRKRALAEIFG